MSTFEERTEERLDGLEKDVRFLVGFVNRFDGAVTMIWGILTAAAKVATVIAAAVALIALIASTGAH